MHRLLILALFIASVARAQEDQPIPYPDEEGPRKLPRRSGETYVDKEVPVEKADREKNLGRFDDPNKGFAGELFGGAMLLASSKGAGVDPSPTFGVRFTWEYGRLLPDEFFHEALFADVSWAYAWQGAGTTAISASSNYHYFTIAPGFLLPFGYQSWIGAYAQVGGGFAYQADFVSVATSATQVTGVKPLLQYGVGIRARPPLNSDGTFRLAIRVEATRFRRGYLDDTFLGLSVGADF